MANLLSRNLLRRKLIPSLRINLCGMSTKPSLVVADKRQLVTSHYPNFAKEMKAIVENFDPHGAEKHFERMLQYNIPGGKMNRAQMVVSAFEEIAPKIALTEANFTLSAYLGWCLEVFQAIYIILDDVMDGSYTRRGKPCWYKQENVHLSAVNDAIVLEAVTYDFLKKHFSHMQCYVKILETFLKNSLIITIGESMDLASPYQDVLTFTMEQYRKIVTYKAAHHSIYTPIELAFNLAGFADLQTLHSAKDILYEMGSFFQIQDDFLDCYGDPAISGKIGSDIREGKCTWFVVTFLQCATEAQKATLKEFYGKKDEDSVQRVKKLYEDVNLREIYIKYEEEAFNAIKDGIQQAKGIPTKLCLDIMDKFFKRNF